MVNNNNNFQFCFKTRYSQYQINQLDCFPKREYFYFNCIINSTPESWPICYWLRLLYLQWFYNQKKIIPYRKFVDFPEYVLRIFQNRFSRSNFCGILRINFAYYQKKCWVFLRINLGYFLVCFCVTWVRICCPWWWGRRTQTAGSAGNRTKMDNF